MNTFIYDLSKLLGCTLAHLFFRVRKVGFKNLPEGPYVLVCNHVSHFDPPIVVLALSQRVEFMAWHKLFASKFVAAWLRAVGCFSLDVTRPDVRSVREAIRRLRASSIVGVFPEGGIRTGLNSVLEGHPLSLGAAGLASLGRCPVRACLVLGTDQLYDWHKWFQRPEIYIVCGREFALDPALAKRAARQKLTRELQAEFQSLYRQTLENYRLSNDMIPRTAQERWTMGDKHPSTDLGKTA